MYVQGQCSEHKPNTNGRQWGTVCYNGSKGKRLSPFAPCQFNTMEQALLELRDCKNLKEVDAFIDKHFPKGLHEELHKPKDEKSMFYPSGAYIGFNLHRYIYNNKLAAFCHAVRDNFCGYGGSSYWTSFNPHVKDPDPEATKYFGQEVWEVYTGTGN